MGHPWASVTPPCRVHVVIHLGPGLSATNELEEGRGQWRGKEKNSHLGVLPTAWGVMGEGSEQSGLAGCSSLEDAISLSPRLLQAQV